MKKITLFIGALLVSFAAYAGFGAYQGTTSLGVFGYVKCSTGLTCTKVGDKLNIVSSPTLVAPLTLENGEILSNTTDDTVQVASDDNDTTFQILGFEAKNAILNLWADQGDDAADKFSITATTTDTLVIKNNTTTLATYDSSGGLVGNGAGALSGYLNKQVAATATTITAAQCGSTFYNTGAVAINLPEASTAVGCRLTFVTLNAANFDINPDNADQILVLTDTAGDMIRNATLGNTVVLQAVSASQWVEISAVGTWSDAN